MARWKFIATVLMLSWGVSSCGEQEQAKAEDEKRQALVAKKDALHAYLGSVQALSERLEAFGTVLKKVQSACQQCDIEAHKEEFKEKVLPAFEALIASLDAMPTATKELEAIHGKLAEAYRTLGAMLAEYSETVTSNNQKELLVARMEALTLLRDGTEKSFRQELTAYCSSEPKVDCSLSAKD